MNGLLIGVHFTSYERTCAICHMYLAPFEPKVTMIEKEWYHDSCIKQENKVKEGMLKTIREIDKFV